jgi:ribosomal protein L40E
MSEIVCRNCGAQNPAQSKFCNKCGETLASQTSQLCPSCEAQNPLDLLYCDNCGTRLADDDLDDSAEGESNDSSAGAQPFSLPSRPPGSTGNLDVSGEIPSWLKTGEMDNSEMGDGMSGNPGLPDEEEETLSLAELSGEHEPSDDLPMWLLEDESADEIFYSEKSTDELFNDPSPAAQEDSDNEEETPDWLQGLNAPNTDSLPSMEDEPAGQDTGEADWFVVDESEEDDSLASAELESWLKAMEEDEQTPEEALEEEGLEDEGLEDEALADEVVLNEEALPEQLDDEQEVVGAVEEGQQDEDASETDLPSWLSEFELEAEEPASHAQIEDDSSLPEVPDWLLENEEAPGERSDGPQQTAPPEGDDEIPEEDFMAWLASLDEDSPEEEAVEYRDDVAEAVELELDFELDAGDEAPPQSEEEAEIATTPAWLDELTEVMDEQVEAEATAPDEMPEWLQTLSPEVDEQPSSAQTPDAQTPPAGEPEEPAFADLSEGEEDDDLELPDWLGRMETELDDDAEEALLDELAGPLDSTLPGEVAEPENVEDDSFDFLTADDAGDEMEELVASEDLPDWFSDVLDDIEGEEALGLDSVSESDLASGERASVPPQMASNDLPEWLDSPFTDLPEAEPTPIDEIPEWLLPMAPGEADMAEEPEEMLNLGEAESSSEWFDLLDALPPPERDKETLTEAEIPEWLRALKPQRLREAGELEEEEAPLPEESEGPLAGLRGVLAISPVVSHPRAAERSDPELVVTEQQQQVTLLRQLAREESQETISRGAAETVPSYSAATRIVLALLLLAAVIGGLLFPELLPDLEAASSATLGASQSLLDEAAGKPVIVAFDYSPALNGILQPQANAILQALAANDSQAILLSQSAAGATLAEQAAASVDNLQSANIGYVAGDSIGLRNLSGCMAPGAACQTVSGRSLDEETVQSLQNAALLVVLTGDQENLLDWIEQVESATELPMMAVVTPAIAPLTAPYQQTGQVAALVSNLPPPDTGGSLQGATAALALGHWLAAALLLLGALFTLIRGVQQGQQ